MHTWRGFSELRPDEVDRRWDVRPAPLRRSNVHVARDTTASCSPHRVTERRNLALRCNHCGSFLSTGHAIEIMTIEEIENGIHPESSSGTRGIAPQSIGAS